MSSEDGANMEGQIDKRVLLLNEFIYANEGKPREIAQVVDVTQVVMKDYLKPMVLSNLTIPVSHIPLVLRELVHA